MEEHPLPHVVWVRRKRESIIGLCVLALCIPSSFALIVVVDRYATSYLSLLWVGAPWLVYIANDVRVYLWKRRLYWKLFEQDRLKGRPCEHCLYDCTGNVSWTCPECGAEIPVDLEEKWKTWRRSFWLVRLRGRLGR